jgi:hypothetical protein
MRILAIDPSLTCCGWAIFDRHHAKLLHVGRIMPGNYKKPLADRLDRIRDGLTDLPVDSFERVVIEVPSGHVGRNRHQGGGAGLSRYGMAVGYVIGVTASLGPPSLVTENEWTNSVPKKTRTMIIQRTVPGYNSIPDPGGDIADAIGIGQWWLQKHKTGLG